MSNNPPTGQGSGDDTELPDELNEFVDAVTEGDGDGPTSEEFLQAAEDSDELAEDDEDMDPRVEWFGKVAGGLVLPVLVVALFVGPWRLFDFSLSAGTIPFTVRETVTNVVLVVPLAVIAVINAAVGAAYRMTTEDRPEEYRVDIVGKVIEIQVIISIVVYLLLLVVIAGMGVLDGELVGAVLLVVLGLIGLVFFSFFELLAVAIAVGIPAFVGVFVGDVLGMLWNKSQT